MDIKLFYWIGNKINISSNKIDEMLKIFKDRSGSNQAKCSMKYNETISSCKINLNFRSMSKMHSNRQPSNPIINSDTCKMNYFFSNEYVGLLNKLYQRNYKWWHTPYWTIDQTIYLEIINKYRPINEHTQTLNIWVKQLVSQLTI